MTTEYVRLLGPAEYRRGTERVRFVPDKRYQLLAFLAYGGGWVRREELAYLFWPDSTTATSRQNLRELLARVLRLPWIHGLEVDRQGMCWAVPTDVALFRQALERRSMEEALAHYGGPLLQGLESDRAPQFGNWLELEREHVENRWREAVFGRAAELGRLGRHEAAGNLLAGLLERDDLDEEALRAFMAAAVRGGGRDRALRAYARFEKRLREELNLAPAAATQQLAEVVRQEPAPQTHGASPASDRPPPPLPLVATPFIGRELDLAELRGLLAQPGCRAVVLTGPGGVGKTRLAIQAAQEVWQRYPHGVRFVPLEALAASRDIPTAIATALGIDLQGSDEVLDQVTRWLADKRLLLVLDNLEHLPGAGSVIGELLRRCPDLQLLATSRVSPDLLQAHPVPVRGLPVHPDGGGHADTSWPADAVALFVGRARRANPRFLVTASERQHIEAICRLVEGLPLAIELAAAWTPTLSCAEIAREIERSLDLLTAPDPADPDRHRSMRGVLDHSWRLLGRTEQDVLRRLAVFRGGFAPDAAGAVAGATSDILVGLAEKSLLQREPADGPDGRYGFHPVTHRYLREKLAQHPDEAASAAERHALHFATVLVRQREPLRATGQREALVRIEADLENIRTAWNWLLAEGRGDALRPGCLPLRTFLDIRGRYLEGAELFGRAIAVLKEGGPVQAAALGHAYIARARFLHQLGEYRSARLEAEHGLPLLRWLHDSAGVLQGLAMLGTIAWRIGAYDEARAHHEEALALALTHGDAWDEASSLADLALVEHGLGETVAARSHHQQALRIFRELGDGAKVAAGLNNLAAVAIDLGDLREAQRLLEEGLRLARDHGFRHFIPHLLANLGNVAAELGDSARAESLSKEALAIVRESGDRRLEAGVLADLGQLALRSDDPGGAERYLLASLRLAKATQNPRATLYSVARIAELHAAQERWSSAAALAGLVSRHPMTEQQDRAFAEYVLAGLRERLSAAELASALDRAEPHSLDAATRDLLQEVPEAPSRSLEP